MPPGDDLLWSLVERRAEKTPEALLALDEHGRALSFGALFERSRRVAAELHHRGVRRDTRVAWILPTRLESLVLTAALARLSAVQIPIIPAYGSREVSFILRQAAPRLLILARDWKQIDLPALADAAISTAGSAPERLVIDDRLPERDPGDLPAAPLDPGGAAASPVRWIFYTSGTTSDPKGALHTDATLAASAEGIEAPHDFVHADRVSLVFPYAHIGGPSLLFSALRVGYCLILAESFDPKVVIDAFVRHGVTLAGSGPAFWRTFIDAQRERPEARLFPRLRALIGGGAAKPANIDRESREVLGVDVVSGYGLTECPALAYNHVGDPEDVLATDGRAVRGVEIRIVRRDGGPAPPGEEGEIHVRGPMLFRGYLDAALDAETFDSDGFLITGDLGRLDERGQLRVTGRSKDVIIRKGENISAGEVEDLLVEHPKVRAVAVVGLPDPTRGERCCAVVVPIDPRDPPSLDEVVRYCEEAGLMKAKTPEQVESVAALPTNSTGKVLKAALRERFGAASAVG